MTRVNVSVRLLRGPDHYWTVAQECGDEGFTITELWKLTNGVKRSAVVKWVDAMVASGALRTIGSRPGTPQAAVVYAVTRRTPPARPEGGRGDVRLNLWTAMRSLPQFTVTELAAAAATDVVPVKRETALEFVRQLASLGVLVTVRPATRHVLDSGVYRLKPSHNTGPRPPRWVKASFLYDPNVNRSIGDGDGESAA